MCDEPYWDKDRMKTELEVLGIELPYLYRMGHVHNNCGGKCFAAGQAAWRLALSHDREGYLEDEEQEQKFIALHGNHTILKDRRGGTTKPLSLRDFRKRVECGQGFDKEDWGGCGCSVSFDKPVEDDSWA